MKLKILHCSISHLLDDSRIFYKECVSLAKENYDVTFIANMVNHDKFSKEEYNGVKLLHFKSQKKIYKIFELLTLSFKYDIIHFHDFELIFYGIFLKFFKKKIIYDVHEDYRTVIFHRSKYNRLMKYIIYMIIKVSEYISNIMFDVIIVTTPKIKLNFTDRKSILIRNFPTILRKNNYIKNFANKKNIIIYIGTLSKLRGIKELILSTENLKQPFELWLLGDWVNNDFKKECENLIEFSNTKYLGKIDHEDLQEYLIQATIGICILHPLDQYKDSYPLKVFEYMQNGIPVLMSNFNLWKNMFGDACEYTDPLNINMISEKISKLLNNVNKLETMSNLGQILIKDNYNWDTESKKLIDCYTNF